MDTLYSQALDIDGNGFNGYTWVMRFPASVLTLPSYSPSKMQVTFQSGSTEGLIITNAYVGHKAGSGDAYDFAATPVQFLFAGSTSKTIATNSSATTDPAFFTYDKTSDLLIAVYTNGGTGNDMIRRKTGLSASIVSYERSATNEAGTVNKTTGYTATAGSLYSINKIEVDIAGNGFLIFF